MQKLKKISSALVAGALSCVLLTVTVFAAKVDVFTGDWSGTFPLNNSYAPRTMSNAISESGYSVNFSAVLQNTEKNSTKTKAMASSVTYQEVNFGHTPSMGTGSQNYMNVYERTTVAENSGDDSVIVLREGDTVNLTPFIQAYLCGVGLDYEKETSVPLYDLKGIPFITDATGKSLFGGLPLITTQDEMSYDFLSYKVSGNDISVTPCDNIGSAVSIKANKTGAATLMVTMTGRVDTLQVTNGDKDFYKAILPSLRDYHASKSITGQNSSYITKGGIMVESSLFRYTANFVVKVVPKSTESEFILEDTKIKGLNEVYEDCDFAVASNEIIPISATIDNHPYSAAVKCDGNVTISTTHSSNGYLTTRTYDDQEIKFTSPSTKIYTIDFGGCKKKVKVISASGSFEKFKNGNISALNTYLKDEGVLIKVGKEESMASLISSAMNDVTGSTNYGIPMFPSSKSIKIDDFDKKYLNNTKYDRLKAIAETPGTEVTLSIGDTILYVNIITSNMPTTFYVIPATTGSYAELKNKTPDELKELAIPNNYTMYQESELNVYILQYPRVNKSVNVSIPYGSSVASIKETDTPYLYTITTSKTDNYFTLRMTEKEDNASGSLRMHVMYIDMLMFDPAQLSIKYNINNDLRQSASNIHSPGDVEAAKQQAMNEANSNSLNKTKVQKFTLYVNNSKYFGNVYYIIDKTDKNVAIETSDWQVYSPANGIHSDVYKGKGTLNLKISYSDKVGQQPTNIVIYAFLAPPDGKKTLQELTSIQEGGTKKFYAMITINISPYASDKEKEEVSEVTSLNEDFSKDGYEYPFAGLIPYHDAMNCLSYYYGCELTPKYDKVIVMSGDWESVPIYGKTFAVVPMKVKSIRNGKVTTTNGNTYVYGSNEKIYAISQVKRGDLNLDTYTAYPRESMTSTMNSVNISDASSELDDDLYIWVRVDLPYKIKNVMSIVCSLSYSNGKAVYTDIFGDTYSQSDLKFGVMTINVNNPDGTTGTMGLSISKVTSEGGIIYVTGRLSTGENKKVEYTGQKIMVGAEKEFPITCPESSAPSATSSDPSVATAEMKQPNYGQLQYEKVRLLVEIDGISEGKTTVTVYDYSGNTCDIEVTVPDEFTDNEDDSTVTKHYTVEGTNRGKKYYFDYYFSVPKVVNLKVGESVSVPVEANVTGSNPTYADIKDPYSEIKVNVPSSYKGSLDASFEGHEIELTGLKKGNYTITVWGYKKLIHYDMIVKVE